MKLYTQTHSTRRTGSLNCCTDGNFVQFHHWRTWPTLASTALWSTERKFQGLKWCPSLFWASKTEMRSRRLHYHDATHSVKDSAGQLATCTCCVDVDCVGVGCTQWNPTTSTFTGETSVLATRRMWNNVLFSFRWPAVSTDAVSLTGKFPGPAEGNWKQVDKNSSCSSNSPKTRAPDAKCGRLHFFFLFPVWLVGGKFLGRQTYEPWGGCAKIYIGRARAGPSHPTPTLATEEEQMDITRWKGKNKARPSARHVITGAIPLCGRTAQKRLPPFIPRGTFLFFKKLNRIESWI